MKPLTKEQLAAAREKAGAGDDVEGSRHNLIRDVCAMCGDLIRVVVYDEAKRRYCAGCDEPPPPGTGLCYRQRIGSQKTNS